MDKQLIKDRQQKILSLIESFCKQKLNGEYFFISKSMLEKLARKRNVPFATGRLEIWAAGIIQANGMINFLFDKSFEPFITLEELNAFFGTSKSSVGSKARVIRDLLKLNHFDPEFSTNELLQKNPMNDYVMFDGFIVHLNSLTEEQRQIVIKARSEGKDVVFTTRN